LQLSNGNDYTAKGYTGKNTTEDEGILVDYPHIQEKLGYPPIFAIPLEDPKKFILHSLTCMPMFAMTLIIFNSDDYVPINYVNMCGYLLNARSIDDVLNVTNHNIDEVIVPTMLASSVAKIDVITANFNYTETNPIIQTLDKMRPDLATDFQMHSKYLDYIYTKLPKFLAGVLNVDLLKIKDINSVNSLEGKYIEDFTDDLLDIPFNVTDDDF